MQEKKTWNPPQAKPIMGFAVVAKQTIYAVFADDTGGNSSAILKLDLKLANSNFQEVARLKGHPGLKLNVGPVAVDLQHNRLFAVDLTVGILYQVDFATGRSQEIALTKDLDRPRALVLDSTGHNLYVAATGHVWKVELDTHAVRTIVQDFARPNLKFQLPRALAIDQGDNVWVGERGQFIFSPLPANSWALYVNVPFVKRRRSGIRSCPRTGDHSY